MINNNSANPGFLTPVSGSPLDDQDLLVFLQPAVAAIGGWEDTSLVRPGWQAPDAPLQPTFDVDWAGIRIARSRPDTFQYEEHVPEGEGQNVFEYSEEFDLMVSCFGPRSQAYARRIRDGMRVAQNRSYFQALKMDVVVCGEPWTVPALQQGQWLRRVDVTITMRRVVEERFGVLTLLLPADGGIDNEHYVTPIIVEPPA